MSALDLTDFATVEEIAPEFGLSAWSLREACRRGEWPHRKAPHRRRILVSRAESQAFLDGADLTVKRLAGGGRVVKVRQR